MSISANVVDQRVRKIALEKNEIYEQELYIKNDISKAHSVSFVYLVIKSFLDIPDEDAIDAIVEGGNDFGVDAIYLTPPHDGEFVVTLV